MSSTQQQLDFGFFDIKDEIEKIQSKTCKNCNHYEAWPKKYKIGMGNCKLHAPIFAYTKEGSLTTRYPSVSEDDFCENFES